MRLTIAVPSSMIENANELLCTLGASSADRDTFSEPIWQKDGVQYSLASGEFPSNWHDTFSTSLIAPSWDVDLSKAAIAQGELVFGGNAASGQIAIVANDDVNDALVALGVGRIPDE